MKNRNKKYVKISISYKSLIKYKSKSKKIFFNHYLKSLIMLIKEFEKNIFIKTILFWINNYH